MTRSLRYIVERKIYHGNLNLKHYSHYDEEVGHKKRINYLIPNWQAYARLQYATFIPVIVVCISCKIRHVLCSQIRTYEFLIF
jgi:hypothetical protein